MLNRCLNSIPFRDDSEIIVVDDNSDPDQKPEIEREDVRLVLLDERSSKGAGRARNVGIAMAKGKWLLFADSDDCYTSNLSSLLDKYANDEITDIVYLNAFIFDRYGRTKTLIKDRFIHNYLNGKRWGEESLRYGFWTAWSRMLKRELVIDNNLSFEEIPFGNDMMFGLKASMYSKTIGVEAKMVYQYYRWPKGSITDKLRREFVLDHITIIGKRLAFYNEVGYHTDQNFLSVIGRILRSSNISISTVISTYRQCLRQYHISGVKDFARYLHELLFVRMPRSLKR